MSSDISIKVENLSKRYEIYDQPRDRLKQFVMPRLQHLLGRPSRQYFREFWALKGVSFEVSRGETVGIIGRNGSGKSTLLQMICGTLNPTVGSITTQGRIAALLELGSGFNPEFSGRDNVYMNGAVLGLSKDEVDERFGSIVDFADIGEFIEQPVKTYSSGMMVRLAFAVQAQVSPDILIVDEALAVGDAKFQAKCFERLRQLKEDGTSILLVTHSSEQIVTHCSKAILLDGGVAIEYGEPRHVVNRYMDILFGKEKQEIDGESQSREVDATQLIEDGHCTRPISTKDLFSTRHGYNPHEYRWGDGAVSILDYCLTADGEHYPTAVTTGQIIVLRLTIKFLTNLVRPILGITIKTREGVTVYGVNSETADLRSFQELGGAGTVVEAQAVFHCRLASGDYFISLGVATKEGENVIPHDRRYDAIHLQVRPEKSFFGLVDLSLALTAKQL
jgi:lipopolysaccharide transport system ATP-binding protein